MNGHKGRFATHLITKLVFSAILVVTIGTGGYLGRVWVDKHHERVLLEENQKKIEENSNKIITNEEHVENLQGWLTHVNKRLDFIDDRMAKIMHYVEQFEHRLNPVPDFQEPKK